MRRKEVDRVKKMLVRDKMMIPDNYKALLTSDVNKLLSHYMELSGAGVTLKLKVLDDGSYELKIFAIIDRLKDVPTILPPIE